MNSNLAVYQPPLQRRTFQRRDLIPYTEHRLWRIEAGWVRSMTWDEDGLITTLGFWRSGDVISSMLVQVHPCHFECLTKVEVSLLPPNFSYPEAVLIDHIQQVQTLLRINHQRRIESRLLMFLHWLAQQFGHAVAQGYLIELRLTHQEIADVIGSTRVSITRLLRQLEQQGTIGWSRQRCIVLNMEHH